MKPETADLIRRTIVTSKTSEGLERAIELALKEQDKRTRHACAEAILDPNLFSFPLNVYTMDDVKSRMHQACMNAHSI